MDETEPDDFHPTNTYRIMTADGNAWYESTDIHAVQQYMKPGDTMQRKFIGKPPVQWRDEHSHD